MTRVEKLIEMLNYIGLKEDIMVFEDTEKVVDNTGHRLNGKIVPSYYYTDTVESRAKKIDAWLSSNTDGPNNDDFIWILIFADMCTTEKIGNRRYLGRDTRAFLVLTNGWYD